MRVSLSHVVFIALLLTPFWAGSQTPPLTPFDCGRISGSQSGGPGSYYDSALGFQFDFPANWKGNQIKLWDQNDEFSNIIISPLFKAHDPKPYISDGARVTGTKAINGLEWTLLEWPNGETGYYTYRDRVAIEFVANTTSRTGMKPLPGVLAALDQVISSFRFVDEPFRMDHQIAALKLGQKLGGLTLKNITLEAGGAKVEFAGSLTLTGIVTLESTMGGSTSGYIITDLDKGIVSQIPQLTCPFEYPNKSILLRVTFANQEFAERQFGKRNYYEGEATVVVDRINEMFGNSATQPSITARLVEVLDKPSE